MRNIYILSGLPGSGKSTYISQHAACGDLAIHRDDQRELLRQQLGLAHAMDCPPVLEYERWIEHLRDCLYKCPNVDAYIDQTTLTQGALNKLLTGIAPVVSGNDFITIICIHTNINQCLERNAKRECDARVPDDVIHSMARSMRRDPISTEKTRKSYPWMQIQVIHDTSMEV